MDRQEIIDKFIVSGSPAYIKVEKTPETNTAPSTAIDYWNANNPNAIAYNNPHLRYQSSLQKKYLDVNDEGFRSEFDTADEYTQDAMLKAVSVEHALMIKEKRRIQKEAQEKTSRDPLLTQFGMSILPSLATQSTFIPIYGIAGKAFQIGKQAGKTLRLTKGFGVGATSAMTGALADEYMFEKQGMDAHYFAAGMTSLALGGTLGTFSAALAGPFAKSTAYHIRPEGDSWSKDLSRDPDLVIDSSDGSPKIIGVQTRDSSVAQMSKNFFDYIPKIGEWIKSDVSTVYQSSSQALRNFMTDIANPTISLRDAHGTPIPAKYNAVNFKKEAQAWHSETRYEVEQVFNQYKREGFTGDLEDFIDEVSKAYTKAETEQEKLVYNLIQDAKDIVVKKYDTEYKQKIKEITALKINKKQKEALIKQLDEDIEVRMDAERDKILNNIYDKYEPKFSGNKYVVQGAESYKKFYNKWLDEGKKAGIKELDKIHSNRLYRPVIWDFKAINSGAIKPDVARDILKKALAAHPQQSNLSAKELNELTEWVYQKLSKSAFDVNFMTSSFVAPKELPFASRLQQRKIKVDRSLLGPLLKDHLSDVSGAYSFQMSGRYAMAKTMGVVDAEDLQAKISDIQDQLIAEGATAKEIAAMERIITDIYGTLRTKTMQNKEGWSFARKMMAINSYRFSGGFGGNQFIELGANIMFQGISNIINGRFLKSWVNTGKLLYTKGKVNDDLAETMVKSGFLEQALTNHRVNKYSDYEQGLNPDLTERGLNVLNEMAHKVSGLRYFTAVMEDMTGGAILTQIQKMATKKALSETEVARLARWGLSIDDMKSLASDLDLHYKPNEGKLDLESFSEHNQLKFKQAIQNGVSEAIIQSDSIHLPNWYKTFDVGGPLMAMLTQFMRFPLLAQEVLLRKGFAEEQAKFVASIIGASVTYMGIKYLREQAALGLGLVSESELEYDYFGYNGEEAIQKGLLGSLNYNAPLGMASSLWNYGAIITGNPELGREYISNSQLEALAGPVYGGVISDTLDLSRKIAAGELTPADVTETTLNYILPSTLPIVKEGLDAIEEGI